MANSKPSSKPKDPEKETEATVDVAEPSDKTNELCWNCENHGKKNYLDKYGDCEVCGFTMSTMYNASREHQGFMQKP